MTSKEFNAPARQPREAAPIPEHFRSADSVPRGYAQSRSPLTAPLLLFSMTVFSVALTFYAAPIHSVYIWALSKSGNVAPTLPLLQGSLGLRPFFVVTLALLTLFSSGPGPQRIKATLFSITFFLAFGFLADNILLRASAIGWPGPLSFTGNLTNGFIGVITLIVTVFGWLRLPPPVSAPQFYGQSSSRLLLLTVCVSLAGLAAYAAPRYAMAEIEGLKDIALLGGIGPGLAIFLPTLVLLLFLSGSIERWLTRRHRRAVSWKTLPENKLLSVAFLVPAYNEAHNIAACIRALDRAASNYPGFCRLYLVDNASTDDTHAIAEQTLFSCNRLIPPFGRVLTCLIPGKSNALNFGLSHIQEDLVIRVDADTEVEPLLLQKVTPYFWDYRVGGVAGLTLPKRGMHWISLMRRIEVFYNVAFLRVAQTSVDGVIVLPGIMAAYRTDLLHELGGFGAGFNGEDTDMAVRIGRTGHRLLVDPSIVVRTEVPTSLAHLREQRLRWMRSYFHVLSRNVAAVRGLQGVRGCWTLPISAFSVCRRLVTLPLIIYAAVTWLITPQAPFLRDGVAILALLAGPQVMLLVWALLWSKQPLLLLLLPQYMGFRLLRNYIALESFLTLPIREPEARPARQPLPSRRRAPSQPLPTLGGLDGAGAEPTEAPPQAYPSPAAGRVRGASPAFNGYISETSGD